MSSKQQNKSQNKTAQVRKPSKPGNKGGMRSRMNQAGIRAIVPHQEKLFAKLQSISSRDLYDAVSTIALPEAAPVARLSTLFTTKPTAVARPWSKTDLNPDHTGATTPGSYPDTSSQCAALFRNDLRACVIYTPQIGTTTYQAIWTDASGNASELFNFESNVDTDVTPAGYSYFGNLGGTAPHGDKQYCGVDGFDDRERYVWLEEGDVVTFKAVFEATSTDTIDLYFRRYNKGKPTPEAQYMSAIAQSSPSNTGAVPASDYYAFSFKASDPGISAEVTNVQLYYTTIANAPRFCHLPLPKMENNFLSAEDIRILGATLMYSNTASNLYKGGQCAMRQQSKERTWDEFLVKTSPYSEIANLEGSTSIVADEGMYGYLKPGDMRELDLGCSYDVKAGGLNDSYFPLKGREYLLFALSAVGNDAQRGYYTCRFAIEFLTGDVWRETSVTKLPPSVYEDALGTVKVMPQFYRNNDHLKKIVGQISDFAKNIYETGKTLAPYVMDIVKMIGPVLAAL